MDLDNLKEMWSKEEISQTPTISLEKQKKIHLPLEKIRKNMRGEFWSTVIIFVGIILFFIFKEIYVFKYKLYLITLMISMFLVTVFYYVKFFSLYKNLSDINLNTAESLRDLEFQFKLNKQYYLSFYVAFVPFAIAETLMIFETFPGLKDINELDFVLYFVGACLVMLFGLYFLGKMWFNWFYGKYIFQIEQISNELK